MINNLEQIKPFLEFDSEDEFYYLQIIRRRKDNPHLKGNHNVISHYYIKSIEDLEQKMEEIIGICDGANARAYIYLNRRSFKRCLKEYNYKAAKQELNNHIPIVSQTYHSVMGKFSSEENKLWIVDVDDIDVGDGPVISDFLDTLYPRGVRKTQAVLKTKNGFHLITKGFNLGDFRKRYKDVDVKKDGPTILYIS